MMNVSRANKRYAFASVDAGKLRMQESCGCGNLLTAREIKRCFSGG
jgi:hypothetical protein